MYSLSGYGEMIAAHVRMEAFAQALSLAIRPGSVVLDIGTGPGITAVLACRFGAGHVYAVEPDEIIQAAREVAAANHCAEKIEFFEDLSTKISIPVRADVIVSDLRGVLPVFGHHIPSIVDARQRLLAPGSTLIAREDTIWAAVVEAPQAYGRIRNPWDSNPLGQNLAAPRRKVLNQLHKTRVGPEQLLTAPALWATLDYATIECPDVRSTLQWKAERNGIGHGILVWFDSELAEGVTFSNSPLRAEMVYGAAFFPWLEPVPLAAGQAICANLEAKLLDDDYFWRWTTHIESAQRAGEIVAHFEQSQLQGAVLSVAKLHKSAADFIPQLSREGLALKRTLELMDGTTSLDAIARQLTGEFPERFTRWQQALSFAAAVSKDCSR